MDAIQEKAREVGRLIAHTEEYRALKRANDRLQDDREAVQYLNRLSTLEEEIAEVLQKGREPDAEQQEEYQSLFEKLQQLASYQGVVAAQSNFDRLMVRINEEIARGIEAGDRGRIILPS